MRLETVEENIDLPHFQTGWTLPQENQVNTGDSIPTI